MGSTGRGTEGRKTVDTNTEEGSIEEGTTWQESRRLPEEGPGAHLGEETFRLRNIKCLESWRSKRIFRGGQLLGRNIHLTPTLRMTNPSWFTQDSLVFSTESLASRETPQSYIDWVGWSPYLLTHPTQQAVCTVMTLLMSTHTNPAWSVLAPFYR